MDLLKAFDCIPNDLLVPKPSAYGFNGNTLKYIYTYNVSSDFKENILGIPQSSIVGSILFNALFLNDFFFCVRKASAHNFTDDNAPSWFARSVKLLLEILIAESENVITWGFF